MTEDNVQLRIVVGVLVKQVESMQRTLDNQAERIEELLELYNKGKGAAWILVGLGSLAGALFSKLLTIVPMIVK